MSFGCIGRDFRFWVRVGKADDKDGMKDSLNAWPSYRFVGRRVLGIEGSVAPRKGILLASRGGHVMGFICSFLY